MNDKYKDLRDALANFNKYPWSDETRNKIIRAVPGLLAERDALRAALKFYADQDHFIIADDAAWEAVSGEPQNYFCDEAGTAVVEDGSVARAALAQGGSDDNQD